MWEPGGSGSARGGRDTVEMQAGHRRGCLLKEGLLIVAGGFGKPFIRKCLLSWVLEQGEGRVV